MVMPVGRTVPPERLDGELDLFVHAILPADGGQVTKEPALLEHDGVIRTPMPTPSERPTCSLLA